MLRRVPITEVPSEPELGIINVLEQAAKPARSWRLAFDREHGWLHLPDEQSAFVVGHAELAEHGNLVIWGSGLVLGLRGLLPEGRAIAFRIDADGVPAFRRFIHARRDLHLAVALKKRLRFSLPLGIFLSILAFLGKTIDPFLLVYGVGVSLLAIVGPRMPRPWLYAVEAALWLTFGVSFVIGAVHGSKTSIVFAILCGIWARTAWRTFGFYRSITRRT